MRLFILASSLPGLRLGLIQRHGGANERLERLLVDLVALMEIDGAPRVSFEARVEEREGSFTMRPWRT
jgi:hypothetical protein